MLVTINDVARVAQTSTATVSQTLNRPDRVAAKTRSRVLAAVRKLKYSPNLHARNLAARVTRNFGMIVSDVQNPFYGDAIRAFESRARHYGYEAVVSHTNHKPHLMWRATERMLEQKVSGVAILTSEMSPKLMKQLTEQNVAVAFNDFGFIGERVSDIRFDYASGVGQAADHLYRLGHRRIAFVGGRSQRNIKSREVAYLESMRRLGLPPGPLLEGNQSVDGGYAAGLKFVALVPRPTAIIALNDLTAIGVARALYEKGVKIPQDVSIVGFDRTYLAEYFTPSLTSVDMHAALLGRIAVDSLYAMCKRKAQRGKEYVIPVELVVGESTGPAPGTAAPPAVELVPDAKIVASLEPERELETVAV